MAGRKRYSVMRDPVHGDIYLTHEELRVLDTPEMQRMRGIKQLGPAYLVFPGALHTRFDHSIGTVHVAQRIIDAINRSFDIDPARGIAIGDEEARVVRMAGLLHDVTHIPFGHNIEDQDALFERRLGVPLRAALRADPLGRRARGSRAAGGRVQRADASGDRGPARRTALLEPAPLGDHRGGHPRLPRP